MDNTIDLLKPTSGSQDESLAQDYFLNCEFPPYDIKLLKVALEIPTNTCFCYTHFSVLFSASLSLGYNLSEKSASPSLLRGSVLEPHSVQQLEREERNAFSHLLWDTVKPKESWLVLVSVEGLQRKRINFLRIQRVIWSVLEKSGRFLSIFLKSPKDGVAFTLLREDHLF